MNISKHIDYWADKIAQDESLMISESSTPDDEETILASLQQDVSDVKMSPTAEFVEKAYQIMNEKFFDDNLPHKLIFKVKRMLRSGIMGEASYLMKYSIRRVDPIGITLNSSRTMTLHDWLGVVLHEMVHVCDYVENPEHFLGRMKYDAHGYWFMEYGKRFEQYGFHIQRYCKSEVGINTDDITIQNKLRNSVFIIFDGYGSGSDRPIIQTTENLLDKNLHTLAVMIKNGRLRGTTGFTIMKTDNPNVLTKLKTVRIPNAHVSLRFYFYNPGFEDRYGPFRVVKKVSVQEAFDNSPIRTFRFDEDRDEEDIDTMNIIDDEYAKHIYDNITNVVDVEKVDDDTYKVSIT